MRLNGWQRLGIVASVAWAVGAGIWAADQELRSYNRTRAHLFNVCLGPPTNNIPTAVLRHRLRVWLQQLNYDDVPLHGRRTFKLSASSIASTGWPACTFSPTSDGIELVADAWGAPDGTGAHVAENHGRDGSCCHDVAFDNVG